MRHRNHSLVTLAALLGLLIIAAPASAKEPATIVADASSVAPASPFHLSDLDWLTGSWVGEHFGDKAVEVVSPIEGDSMVGYYRSFNTESNTLSFLETDLIQENAEGVFWYFHLQGPAGATIHSPFDSFSAYQLSEIGDQSATFVPVGGDGSVISQKIWRIGNTLHSPVTMIREGKPVEISFESQLVAGAL
ncbi:MAG: DUF6265 family protein [bacterium]